MQRRIADKEECFPKKKKSSQFCDLLSSGRVSVSMISDSKLVPIAFIDVASRLLLPPPLVSFCEGKDHAVSAALAPFLLISLKSGAHEQRRDLVVIFEVSKETLPHFFFQGSSIKTVRVHARRLRILKIAYPETKHKRHKHFPPPKYYQHIILYVQQAGR